MFYLASESESLSSLPGIHRSPLLFSGEGLGSECKEPHFNK